MGTLRGRKPVPLPAQRQTRPGDNFRGAQEFPCIKQLLKLGTYFWQWHTVSFERDPGDRQRGRTMDTSIAVVKPSQAFRLSLMSGLIMECQQRPRGRQDQWLSIDTVDAGIAAVPSTLRAHPVVENSDSQFEPSRKLRRSPLRRTIP